MKHLRNLIILFISILFQVNIGFCQEKAAKKYTNIERKADTLQSIDQNLYWGIAGDTGTILDKRYFVINHNNDMKVPYWVAYHLTFKNLKGSTRRTNDFKPDPELPMGSRSELDDYKNSGFDRGHNAPPEAFKMNRQAMSTTFLLSNISPQTPKLNRNTWKNLESQVHELVMEGGEAWIFTGNLFLYEYDYNVKSQNSIGDNCVGIPTHCFKTILYRNDIGEFSMYAFLIPNLNEGLSSDPWSYLISVDRLEDISRFDFYPGLDDKIENTLEMEFELEKANEFDMKK